MYRIYYVHLAIRIQINLTIFLQIHISNVKLKLILVSIAHELLQLPDDVSEAICNKASTSPE